MEIIPVEIGGLLFAIKTDEKSIANVITREFALYNKSVNSEHYDILINVSTSALSKRKNKSRNPKFISLNEDDSFSFNGAEINYTLRYDETIVIDVEIKTYKNALLRFIRKFLNIEYSNRVNRVGQILHENLIIPIFFLFDKYCLIHASSFSHENRTTLISGTGGVGKTSLEIALCSMDNNQFISDDICVIKDAKVYPNFSYPKIYAYNLIGDKPLKSKLFQGRNILDRLQWSYKLLKGNDKVRRRISPQDLYGEVNEKPTEFRSIVTLVKCNTEKLHLRKVSAKESAIINVDIITNEYSAWFNTLRWVNINQQYFNIQDDRFSVDKRLNKMKNELEKSFSSGASYILEVPFNIDHSTFKKEASEIIMQMVTENKHQFKDGK